MTQQIEQAKPTLESQVKEVADIIDQFPMFAGIISFFVTTLGFAILATVAEKVLIDHKIPGYVGLSIVCLVGWLIYRLQRDVLYKGIAIPRWLIGSLYLITAVVSVPLGIYSVEMTRAAGESIDVVFVSAFFFPLLLAGITYGFGYWLKYLQTLSRNCQELPKLLNSKDDLYEDCLEALGIYERLGPEIIRSHRSSYSINHKEKFKPEYLQCVKDGITEKTIFLLIPMINATFRLKNKQ